MHGSQPHAGPGSDGFGAGRFHERVARDAQGPAAPAGRGAATLSCADRRRSPSAQATPPRACAICLCENAEDEEVIALPCRHSYHARCVGDWLQRSPTCPSCSLDVAKALDIELAPTAAEQRERANRHRILYFPTQEELEDEQEEFRRELDDSEDDEEALMREEEELLRAEEEELALRAEAQDDVDAMLHRAEDQMLQAERELEAEELAAAQLD